VAWVAWAAWAAWIWNKHLHNQDILPAANKIIIFFQLFFSKNHFLDLEFCSNIMLRSYVQFDLDF
jgi:hypothetical protein